MMLVAAPRPNVCCKTCVKSSWLLCAPQLLCGQELYFQNSHFQLSASSPQGCEFSFSVKEEL